MAMPSITVCGSPSSTARSMKAPGSPSSALQMTYFWSLSFCRASFHLRPVGKPAPPRPRSPDFSIAAMISSGFIEVSAVPRAS